MLGRASLERARRGRPARRKRGTPSGWPRTRRRRRSPRIRWSTLPGPNPYTASSRRYGGCTRQPTARRDAARTRDRLLLVWPTRASLTSWWHARSSFSRATSAGDPSGRTGGCEELFLRCGYQRVPQSPIHSHPTGMTEAVTGQSEEQKPGPRPNSCSAMTTSSPLLCGSSCVRTAGKLAFASAASMALARTPRMLVSNVGEPEPERSDDVHNGHLLLGRIALHENDVERAKAHLILAGRAGATFLIPILGPDMKPRPRSCWFAANTRCDALPDALSRVLGTGADRPTGSPRIRAGGFPRLRPPPQTLTRSTNGAATGWRSRR